MSLTGPATGQPDPMVLSSITDDMAAVVCFLNQAGGSSTHGGAGAAVFVPVRLSQRHTYVKAWWQNGLAVAGNVDVGVYTLSGTTMTRVAASTAEAQATASVTQVAATFGPVTIGPGLYYLALGASSATAAFYRASLASASISKLAGMFQTLTTGHPLPSSCTVVSPGAFTVCPIFGLSESAVI